MVDALLEWGALLNLAAEFLLIFDDGSRLASELIARLGKATGFSQQFSVEYCPWTNGECEYEESSLHKDTSFLIQASRE